MRVTLRQCTFHHAVPSLTAPSLPPHLAFLTVLPPTALTIHHLPSGAVSFFLCAFLLSLFLFPPATHYSSHQPSVQPRFDPSHSYTFSSLFISPLHLYLSLSWLSAAPHPASVLHIPPLYQIPCLKSKHSSLHLSTFTSHSRCLSIHHLLHFDAVKKPFYTSFLHLLSLLLSSYPSSSPKILFCIMSSRFRFYATNLFLPAYGQSIFPSLPTPPSLAPSIHPSPTPPLRSVTYEPAAM